MKKMLSAKTEALIWVLRAIFALVLLIAAHYYRSGEALLSGIVIIACILFIAFCLGNAYVKFKRIKIF